VFCSGEPFGTYVYRSAMKGVKYIIILAYRGVSLLAGFKDFGLVNMTSCILVYINVCINVFLVTFLHFWSS